ncbi:MAG: aldehyde dehydrogenase (NADP(+)) [Candidatus Acidiferrales bacterium]
MTIELTGRSIIGLGEGSAGNSFQAYNPATGAALPVDFHSATAMDLDHAANLASAAFERYSRSSGAERAKFLRLIAGKIEALAEAIVERSHLETALPKPRLQGEVARTCSQLRLFASIVEEGSWVGARIDRADPNRKPMAKPDIRSMQRPLGPVAIFGASNFPLAFSVAGGDTASALAAGNPAIVKAHPAHPGTSELAGGAIRESVREAGLPEGLFSLLFDSTTAIGAALVQHPKIKAVGFTGSLAAGRALMDLAMRRPEPIPFYGEMGSTNPVFLLPGALEARGKQIAASLYGSVTMGAGQFCTKPGVVLVRNGASADALEAELRAMIAQAPGFTLLTAGIARAYTRDTAARKNHGGLKLAAEGGGSETAGSFAAAATLFQTSVADFLKSAELSAEVFGPSTLLVRATTKEEILQAARKLEGHLTATIHGTEDDLREYAELIGILEKKVGRIVFNGFPTGVEVGHAMVHGGPYPASTDSRSTSVGTLAIYRFSRPVCYQDFPDAALPESLQNANPLKLWRLLDGELTQLHL